MGFRVRECELAELTASTASGRIQVPDFQRDYRWGDEQVRQLLVTVAEGHPLGAVLVLEAGNPRLRLGTTPVDGTRPEPGTVPELLVLDGQHRLSSLTQALTGSGVVHTEDAGSRRYFLHVPTALARPDDLNDAVRSVPSSGQGDAPDVSTRDLELAHGYFPLGSVLSDDGLAWLAAYGDAGEGDTRPFLDSVIRPMRTYVVPTIELDRQTTTEAVVTVFERINRSSERLSVFELLTARFAWHRSYLEQFGEPFRLRDDWAAIRAVLDDFPVLDRFGGDDFLQAVTLVATHAGPHATTARRADVLELSLVDYLVWAPRVCDALRWVADFLDEQHLHAAGDLPYPQQLVPLAAIRTVLGEATAAYGAHAKVRQWFWCGILGELYGGAVETRFVLDLEQVPDWATGGATTPDTVARARFEESRLEADGSALYKGAYALMMGLDAMEWVYDESFDRAHYLRLKLAADGIDSALLGVADADAFFTARRAALRAMVEEVMGKPVPSEEG
jgi:hypothetical protein